MADKDKVVNIDEGDNGDWLRVMRKRKKEVKSGNKKMLDELTPEEKRLWVESYQIAKARGSKDPAMDAWRIVGAPGVERK